MSAAAWRLAVSSAIWSGVNLRPIAALVPMLALALMPTVSLTQQEPVAAAGTADTLSTASDEAIVEEAQRVKHDDLAQMSEEAHLPSGQIITEIAIDGDGPSRPDGRLNRLSDDSDARESRLSWKGHRSAR
jgi:hypothetical protein